MNTDLSGLRRFVEGTLGGPRRAADELAAVLTVIHAAAVAGLLALTWFDATDVQLLLTARSSFATALDAGTTPGAAALAWAISLVGSYSWWAAALLLVALVLVVDVALWWLVRELVVRPLRGLVVFALVLVLSPMTAAATDFSIAVSVLPGIAFAAASVAAAGRRRRLNLTSWAAIAALAGLAATVFLPAAGLVAIACIVVAGLLRRTEAAVCSAVVSGLAGLGLWLSWPENAGISVRSIAHSMADATAALGGWPVWWRSDDHGMTAGFSPLATIVAAVVVVALLAFLAAGRSPRSGRSVGILAAGVALASSAPAVIDTPRPIIGWLAPITVAAATALGVALSTTPTNTTDNRHVRLRRRPQRIVAGASVLIAAVAALASAITLVVVRSDSDVLSDYVQSVEATARRTGTIELADTDIGPQLMPSSVGTTSVAEFFARSRGVHVRRAGNDLRVANPLGFLKLATIVDGVFSAAPEPGSCGTLVRRNETDTPVVVGALANYSPRPDDWLAIDYLASQDDQATLTIDGQDRELPVIRGPHTYLFQIGATQINQVSVTLLTPASTICVARVRVGTLIASEFS